MQLFALRKALTYAMMVIGFMTLHLSRELSPVVVPLFYAGAVVSWFWEEPRISHERQARAWTVATLAVFAFTLFDIFVIGEFFLISAMNFVLFLATAKLFQRAEHKDYTQAMALSLLVLAAGSVLNENLSFGLLFAAYTMVATVALVTQHLQVEVSEHHGRRGRNMRMEGPVLAATLTLAVLVFAGSAVFFFTFPRVGVGAFVQQNRQGVTSSGFGDDVQLGEHGTIREDSTIVMRVVFLEPPQEQVQNIHWRGLSLDFYDGRSWHDRDDERVDVIAFADGEGFSVVPGSVFTSWEEVVAGSLPVEVNLEPLDSDVVFSPGRLVALSLPNTVSEVPASAFGRAIEADRSGEVKIQTRGSLGVRYIGWWRPQPDPTLLPDVDTTWSTGHADLRAALTEGLLAATKTPVEHWPLSGEEIARAVAHLGIDDNRRRDWIQHTSNHYLQLPSDAVTPRMAAWTSGLRDEHPDTLDYAIALERRLSSELDYTTDLPQPSSPEANLVDEFLFEWQRGHCEYFATAMVVLLREQGIPARIVNGFLGADYNEVGEYWNVRQANAHSWVEAFFPEAGWVRFDPTPAGSVDMGPGGRFRTLALWVDSLRLKWFRWVVEYDLEKQFTVVRDALRNLTGDDEASRDAEFRVAERLRQWFWWLWRNSRALATHLLLFGASVWFYRRRAGARIPWGPLDFAWAASWTGLAVAAVAAWWDGGLTAMGLLVALTPVVLVTGAAWLIRRDLMAPEADVSRSRSAGTARVSWLYARLLRDIEREDDTFPLSITVLELRDWLRGLPAEVTEVVDRFLALYERARFGGVDDDDAVERAGRDLRRLRRPLRRAVRDRARERERAIANDDSAASADG